MNSIRINGEGPFSQDGSGVVLDPGRWELEREEPKVVRLPYDGSRSSPDYQTMIEYRAFIRAYNSEQAQLQVIGRVVLIGVLAALISIGAAVGVAIRLN